MREALAKDQVESVYDSASRRYDFYHALATLRSDQRGRELVVKWGVQSGDKVLDAGGGTGSTALLAAKKAGPEGEVTVFDLSGNMLEVGEARARKAGLHDQMKFVAGDLLALPFEDESFDCVLSTYSLCPVGDPSEGALELYRVLRKGGRFACAHSAEPQGRVMRGIAGGVERALWNFPSLTLGCRAVEVLPALLDKGAKLVKERRLGVPIWPFYVFMVEKPAS